MSLVKRSNFVSCNGNIFFSSADENFVKFKIHSLLKPIQIYKLRKEIKNVKLVVQCKL